MVYDRVLLVGRRRGESVFSGFCLYTGARYKIAVDGNRYQTRTERLGPPTFAFLGLSLRPPLPLYDTR